MIGCSGSGTSADSDTAKLQIAFTDTADAPNINVKLYAGDDPATPACEGTLVQEDDIVVPTMHVDYPDLHVDYYCAVAEASNAGGEVLYDGTGAIHLVRYEDLPVGETRNNQYVVMYQSDVSVETNAAPRINAVAYEGRTVPVTDCGEGEVCYEPTVDPSLYLPAIDPDLEHVPRSGASSTLSASQPLGHAMPKFTG